MDTMYSIRGRQKKRKVRTLFIGKKILVAIAILLSFSFIHIASNLFPGEYRLKLPVSFYRNMTVHSLPVLTAGLGADVFEQEKELLDCMLGTDFADKRLNFRVIPYFYGVNRIERNVSVTGMDYVSHLSESQRVQEEPVVSDRTNPSDGLKIKNETSYSVDTDFLVDLPCDIVLTHKEPEILIVHTHGSESYTQSDNYRYSQSDYGRCQDINYNVVRVGDELERELKKRGFNVIHDKTINDYPSYNKSYTKTLEVIEAYLKKYPSVKCVFDVHRDAVTDEDGTKIKFTADVNGEKVGQVMIVCGSDQLGLENPLWQKNLATALKIQKYLNTKYPGLMRPVNLRKERFNLHKTTGSFIFEFGTHGNTLDEVLASVKYFADGIDGVLN